MADAPDGPPTAATSSAWPSPRSALAALGPRRRRRRGRGPRLPQGLRRRLAAAGDRRERGGLGRLDRRHRGPHRRPGREEPGAQRVRRRRPRSSRRSGGLLGQQGRARRPDRPPAREGPPPRGRGARDDPRGRQGPDRGRGQAVGRAGRVRLHARTPRQAGEHRLGQRHRPRPGRVARPGRAPGRLGGVQDDRRARSATGCCRLRDLRNKVARALGLRRLLRAPGRRLRHDRPRDDRPVRRLRRRRSGRSTSSSTPGPSTRWRSGTRPTSPTGKIPAHWLPNRWGQNWPGLVEGVDMDGPFKGKTKEYITEQAERFYVSLGFPKLPKSFYEKSDLYPADPKSGRKKNSHATRLAHRPPRRRPQPDERSSPTAAGSPRPTTSSGISTTTSATRRPRSPTCSAPGRTGRSTRRIGDLIGLAAGQRPYLKQVGLLAARGREGRPGRRCSSTRRSTVARSSSCPSRPA